MTQRKRGYCPADRHSVSAFS